MAALVRGSYPTRPKHLAFLMKERGFTVESLAKAAGVHYKTIHRFLQGKKLRMTSIVPVAETLRTTPNEIAFIHDVESNQQATEKKGIRLQFAFDVDVPYDKSWEEKHVRHLLNEIGQAIQQIGLLVINSARPGSIRIICIASDEGDVERFFAAYKAGAFAHLKIVNPKHLPSLPDSYDDDDSHQPTEDPSAEDSSDESDDSMPPFKRDRTSNVRYLRGMAIGIFLGGLIGSVVPILGTVFGMMLGGLVGGLLARQKDKAAEHASDESDWRK